MQHGKLLLLFLLLVGCASSPVTMPERRGANALRSEVEAAFERGDLDAARVGLQRMEAEGIADAATLRIALKVYESISDYSRARATADQLLQLVPDDVRALESRGLLLLRQNRLAAAQYDLEKAVTFNVSRWRAWNGLGVIADRQGRYAQARTAYWRGLDVLPDQPQLLANLGWSWLLVGDYSQAEKYLKASISIEPASRVTKSNLAHVIAMQGRYDEAYRFYTFLYGDVAAANNVGYAAYLRGDMGVASDYFQGALKDSARYYPVAAKNLERIDAALVKMTRTPSSQEAETR